MYLHGLAGIEKYLLKLLKIEVKHTDLFMDELHQLFHGDISEELYWQAVIQKREWRATVEDLKTAVRSNFKEIKGTRKIIEQLKTKGYTLGLLSIHAKEWVEYCEVQFDYHRLFNSILYSFDIKLCKPEKGAYESILKKLGVKATDSLFIDDNIKNIIAAKDLGMHAIQFKSARQLEEELKKLRLI